MAANATSTPASDPRPLCPLPPNASKAWLELWSSASWWHTGGSDACMAAYSAGVDPADLCAIQLVAPKDRIQAMPRLWFGESQWHPCRIFSPVGEVEQ